MTESRNNKLPMALQQCKLFKLPTEYPENLINIQNDAIENAKLYIIVADRPMHF